MFTDFGDLVGIAQGGIPFITAAGDLLWGAVAITLTVVLLSFIMRGSKSDSTGDDGGGSKVSTGAPVSRPRRPS